jgi:hypothetical protein
MTAAGPFEGMSYAAVVEYAADRFQEAARLGRGCARAEQLDLFWLAMAELEERQARAALRVLAAFAARRDSLKATACRR